MSQSLHLILPFLRPLQPWIEDSSVSELMVNPSGAVFVERRGLLEKVEAPSLDSQILRTGIKNIARQIGKDFGELSPLLDGRLPNGARICAAWSTVALGQFPSLNIRLFQGWRSIEELVAIGSLPEAVLLTLRQVIADNRNLLISGGVGTGKTSLLRALVTLVDPSQRIITIEDTAELAIESPNVVSLEGKVEQRGAEGKLLSPGISARDLVKLAMRQRGDRLIVGEVRGAEAFDLLKALNSGSSGSLSSIHADTAALALEKLAMYVLEANTGMPIEAIYRNIGSAVHYVLQQERRPDGSRGIAELIRIDGHHGQSFQQTLLYRRSPHVAGAAA